MTSLVLSNFDSSFSPWWLKCIQVAHTHTTMSCIDLEAAKGHYLRIGYHMNASLCRSQPKNLSTIHRSCRAFFMELVSSLCFGAHSAPEPELIKILINMVFTDVGTQDFSPYEEVRSDEVPIIRSFLLRLLLEHK